MRFLTCFLFLASIALADDKPIFLFEHDPSLLTTTVEIDFRAGGLQDPAGKAGLSNLISDLILRGTQKKSRTEFQQTLERLGGSLSGSASTEAIALSGQVIKENTMPFLDLVEETLLLPAFSVSEFTQLKREIVNAIAHTKNSNTSLGGLALRKYIFRGTPMEFPIIGTLSTIAGITRQDVLNKYKNSYHQGNLIVAIASPIPEKDVRDRMERIWSKLPTGSLQKNTIVPVRLPEKPEIVVVNKPKTSTGSLLAAQAGITANDPDRYTLQLADFSFGAEPLVSRLFVTVRGKLGWTYSVGSTYAALGRLNLQPGLYMIYSTPSVEFTGKALIKILDMWREYRKDGLSAEELSLAQESLINSYPFSFDSASKRLGMKMASILYGVPVLSPEEFAKTLNAISNDTIKKTLDKRHGDSAWAISIVADANVIKKQLEEEQAKLPEDQRLKITKIFSMDEVIR